MAQDRPFLIWALRRTGGTAFAALLQKASSHPVMTHEPFNRDRLHGALTRDWAEAMDPAAMAQGIAKALAPRPTIKHCFEVVPLPLNALLLREANRLGYHHIVLTRAAEIDRLFSLEVAALTGAWGPEVAGSIFDDIKAGRRAAPELGWKKSINHAMDCQLRSAWLDRALADSGAEVTRVSFEELYADPAHGRGIVAALLERLGHGPDRIASLGPQIDATLRDKGQKTAAIEPFIANAAEWRRKVGAVLECLNLGGLGA